jgi:effector-binding domain-containing protein
MRVGVPVSASFKNTQTVSCLSLGDCLAAHTMHRGPYEGLPAAHAALNQWCNDQGFTRRGFAWEVYGDWNGDQSKLTTNIYTMIAEDS